MLNHTSITVTWNPPGCRYQNGNIRSYYLQLNDTIGTRMVSGTSHTVSHLRPYQVYGYRVAAFTVGIGPYGEWMFVTMPEPRKRTPVDTNTMQGNIQLYDI